MVLSVLALATRLQRVQQSQKAQNLLMVVFRSSHAEKNEDLIEEKGNIRFHYLLFFCLGKETL